MSIHRSSRSFGRLLAIATVAWLGSGFASPARAAFHLWNIAEVYSNSSGTLQFIEFSTSFGSQQFVSGQSITVDNVGGTLTNMFTIPTHLPADSANRRFLVGTAGIQAAGGPAPDYIIPNGFLFTGGGSINFFGTNSGPYPALPVDGTMSLNWLGGTFPTNTPTNFAGLTGTVVVPEPASFVLVSAAVGSFAVIRRRRRVTTQ
ncbi:MAG: PEP-CTERM sorting domain-containing protein [Gemmataceae bacterium]|nr:PEP-CTERM sorting domain-containing protein [Gemmataceae bacterium]